MSAPLVATLRPVRHLVFLCGLVPDGRRTITDLYSRTEPFPLERLPDVARAPILGRDERVVSPEWSRRVARERLGVEPVELPGGHSPFLAPPSELAALLAHLV